MLLQSFCVDERWDSSLRHEKALGAATEKDDATENL